MSAPGELAISQVWNLGFWERYQKGRLNLFGSLVQRGGEIAFLAASSSTIAARKASQRVSPTRRWAWLVRASNSSRLDRRRASFRLMTERSAPSSRTSSDSPSPAFPYSRSLIVLAVATALCLGKGASRMAIDWPADSAILLSRVSDGSLCPASTSAIVDWGTPALAARSRCVRPLS